MTTTVGNVSTIRREATSTTEALELCPPAKPGCGFPAADLRLYQHSLRKLLKTDCVQADERLRHGLEAQADLILWLRLWHESSTDCGCWYLALEREILSGPGDRRERRRQNATRYSRWSPVFRSVVLVGHAVIELRRAACAVPAEEADKLNKLAQQLAGFIPVLEDYDQAGGQ